MKVITYLQDAYELLSGSVVALGNFDGVHKGHQALIKKTVEIAREKHLDAVVFTFQELPVNVIAGKTVVKNIQTADAKAAVLAELGVDYMVCLPFDKAMRTMKPERFVKHVLVGGLKCRACVCGYNYHFGKDGAGNCEILKELGGKYGMETDVISEFSIDGVTVSSSRIRQYLENGEVAAYELFTGRKYELKGKVITGRQLGTRMGFPTANLALDPDMAHPANGVYITKTLVNGKWYGSVTNVGHKPTVGEFAKNAETHIIGFEGDLYDQQLLIQFIDMLRPERKFDSVEALTEQIGKDCRAALDYFESHSLQ